MGLSTEYDVIGGGSTHSSTLVDLVHLFKRRSVVDDVVERFVVTLCACFQERQFLFRFRELTVGRRGRRVALLHASARES